MEVVLFRSGIVVVINRALLCSYRLGWAGDDVVEEMYNN